MTTETLSDHDDHCWLTVVGKGWKILRKENEKVWVWRGYEPDIEYGLVDLSMLDVERYTAIASDWLVAEMGEPR